MSLQEGLTLAIFAGLAGFMFGCWSSTPLTRFVLRRNKVLAEENHALRVLNGLILPHDADDHNDADWWKKR